jgi:hypothetical protein
MISLILAAAGAAATTPELPAFLTGCWQLAEGDSWTQECWMEPRAGLMIGASREGKGASLKTWEWMSIEHGANGGMTFFASPTGRPRTAFALDRSNTGEVSFVNGSHDFPQRITYRMVNGQLEGEISLLDGSRAIRWRYQPDPGTRAATR